MGGKLYGQYCEPWHGITAIAGGVVSDLRHSAAIGDGETFDAIVRGVILEAKGMVSFPEALSETDVQAIRAHLIRRANESSNQ